MKAVRFLRGHTRANCKALLLACAIGPFAAAHASTYEPAGLNFGISSFYDGLDRPTPGFNSITILQYQNINKFYTGNGSSNPVFNNGRLQVYGVYQQITYLSPVHVPGGNLGFQVFLPITFLNAKDDPGSIVPLTASSGFGDLTFGPYIQFSPLTLGGHPVFFSRLEFDAIAPIGRYDPQKLVNPSSGYWSLNPYYAFTFFPSENAEISMRFHYLYNFANNNPGVNNSDGFPGPVSQFKAGQAVWVNFAASYKVLPNLNVGLNGFWFRQITDDTVNGQTQANARTTKLSMGPGGVWTASKRDFVFLNIYLPVVERNTADGVRASLRWVHEF
jgi:hypothetical protein